MRTPGGVPMSWSYIHFMIEEVSEWVEAKGWNDDRTFGDEMILITSELVEALEAFRSNGYEEWTSYQPVTNGVKMPKMTEKQLMAFYGRPLDELELSAMNPRREGVAPEIAGAFVRILDTCDRHNIDLGIEFRREMDYNWTRTFRHGGKAL